MNVVLVTIDCLRQDRCGLYGHHRDTTPTLDGLGGEGFVFEDAYATGPVTTESFPGILAGRLSADCVAGETLYQKCIPEGEPTLASHLQDHGYETIGVISNPRLGEHVGTDRGFSTFRNLRNSAPSEDERSDKTSLLPDFKVGERLYQLRERMCEHDSVPYRYEFPFLAFRYYQYFSGWPSVRGERVVGGFLTELEDASSPFFAWTNLMDIHGPIHPETVADGGLFDGGAFSQFRSQARRVSDVYDASTEARYDSAVRYVDSQLRRIVDWLKSVGVWDETALIITADHGDALHDRGIYGHPQHYMYDELLEVPLVVNVPWQEGAMVPQSFSLGWLHELCCEILQIEPPVAPLSSSYNEHLGEQNGEEILLGDSVSPQGHSVVSRDSTTKYVAHTDELDTDSNVRIGPVGAFDRTDPKERQSRERSASELEDAASNILVNTNSFQKRSPSHTLDEDTKDRLKQLGYAE